LLIAWHGASPHLPSFPTRRSSDLECLLDGWQPLDIGDWRIGRLHVRNHLDLLFVTGLGQMHFIADPTHVTFRAVAHLRIIRGIIDRKSTRLNSSHDQISYAVFCLK